MEIEYIELTVKTRWLYNYIQKVNEGYIKKCGVGRVNSAEEVYKEIIEDIDKKGISVKGALGLKELDDESRDIIIKSLLYAKYDQSYNQLTRDGLKKNKINIPIMTK